MYATTIKYARFVVKHVKQVKMDLLDVDDAEGFVCFWMNCVIRVLHGNDSIIPERYLYFVQVKTALWSEATPRCGAVRPLPVSWHDFQHEQGMRHICWAAGGKSQSRHCGRALCASPDEKTCAAQHTQQRVHEAVAAQTVHRLYSGPWA